MRKSVRFFLDWKTENRPVALFMYFSFGYKEIQEGRTKSLPLKYSTGYVVHPNQLDAENLNVKDSHSDHEDINYTLAEMKLEAIRTHNSLRDRKRSNQDILITRQRAKQEIKKRTLDHWNSFNNVLLEYEKKHRTILYFDSIWHEFYDKFIILLRDRGQSGPFCPQKT